MKPSAQHRWLLALLLALGALLRFWQLGAQPFWMDEAITALFGLGHSYLDVPLNETLQLTDLQGLWMWQPSSCAAIATHIRQQSTHPPLFFCWLHQWLGWLAGGNGSLAWKLRAFPALMGTVSILAVYRLNRVAFLPVAGLSAAGLMAVSPFALYLAQEARHYTLPMLLITLALLGLVLILQDACLLGRLRLPVWGGWVGVNALGLYIHYFVGLAIAAQVLTMVGVCGVYHREVPRRMGVAIALATLGIVILAIPLLPQLIEHLQRPATDWLNINRSDMWAYIAPILRLLAGLVVMVIMLPVEDQPLAITVVCGLVMLVFAGWVAWQTVKGWQRLWQSPAARVSLWSLASFIGWLGLVELVVIYGLGKDLTLAFRYNFMLYPAVCALLGACLAFMPYPGPMQLSQVQQRRLRHRSRWRLGMVGCVGMVSCVCVLAGLAFHKPFRPAQILTQLQPQGDQPVVVVQTYRDWQTVAFGLSTAVNLAMQWRSNPSVYFQFQSLQGQEPLTQISLTDSAVLALQPRFWVFSPFGEPERLSQVLTVHQAEGDIICQQQGSRQQALNVYYQRYQCP